MMRLAIATALAAIALPAAAQTVTVTFDGKLQAAASVNGPWSDVAGATSPLTISADEAQQYARAVGE